MGTGGARRNDAVALSVETVLHRHCGRGGIGHQRRDPQRRDQLRSPVPQHIVLRDHGLDAANAGGDHAPDAERVVGHVPGPAGLAERLLGGDHSELGEAVQAANLLDR